MYEIMNRSAQPIKDLPVKLQNAISYAEVTGSSRMKVQHF
jgi:hypothetical protein